MPVPPPDPRADDPAPNQAVTRAAALDDCLAGFEPATPACDDPSTHPDACVPVDLLDTILLLRQAAAAHGAVPGNATPQMPRAIGRHAILRLAGEGGFSHVWEGFDTILRRSVAVKVRRPEMLLSEDARRRFIREAEIAARLVHPHIVTIYEVDEDAGREFIAAEFCAGGTLAKWLERHPGPRPPREAVRLVRALAGAAAYAHGAGVIHRDIKPANVLLLPAPAGTQPVLHDERGGASAGTPIGLTAKLGDFGLGKLQDAADGSPADALTQLTRTGASIGTPAWMAPEQIDRSFGAVGPTTDVHALGLLLDRLLTGRAMRGGRTDAETYRQVLLDDPVPVDRVVRSVPRDLAAVVSKCLAKSPGDRYATAADLAADLDRWLAGRPTHARPLSIAGRGLRAVRRGPMVAGLMAASLASTIIAGWTGVERARAARHATIRESEIKRQQAVAELRRGFEALAAGNVAGALSGLEATRGIDAGLAESLAGRWLVRRTHGEQEILLAPEAAVAQAGVDVNPAAPDVRPRDLYAVAVAPSGEMAAVAGADGTVRLLRGLTGTTAVQAVDAHDEVNGVCFSEDGALLASVGQDGRLRWWDVTDSGLSPRGVAEPRSGPLYAVAFAPDGRALAVGGEDRAVWIVDLNAPDSPTKIFQFAPPPGHSPDVESIVFIDAETLAASCGDEVMLIDATRAGSARACDLKVSQRRSLVVGSLTVSRDRTKLMGCGTDSRAHVWDVATGGRVMTLAKHPAWVQGCGFSPDGTRIATACRDGGVRIFDAASGALLERLVGHVGRVWSVVFEPRGTLLTAGADGTVRRWDPQVGFNAAALRQVSMPGSLIRQVGAGPGATLVVADHVLGFFEVEYPRGRVAHLGGIAAGKPCWLACDPRRHRVAISRDTAAPPEVIPVGGAAGPPRAIPHLDGVDATEALLTWTPGGALVAWSLDGSLSWCPSDLRGFRRLATIEGVVHMIAAAPVGPPRVAAVGARAMIHPLPHDAAPALANHSPPIVLPVVGETTSVAWSPDSTLVACGTRAGAIQVFDAATGSPRGALAPHERIINGLAFAPDGRILVSADQDSVRITDTATLTTFDELRHGMLLECMCLTEDGSRLVIAGLAAGPVTDGGARLAVMELPSP